MSPIDLKNEIICLAEESPNFVYGDYLGTGCYYTKKSDSTEGPGCIVGRAILNLKPEYKTLLSELDKDMGLMQGFSTLQHILFHPKVIETFKSELDWICKVQTNQDSGLTWGESIKNANEEGHNNS